MADFKPPYPTLEDLDNVSGSRAVIVRLIQKWEARNPRRGNILMSLDLLLLDEKDNLIKASINHRLIGKFKNNLHEGSILCIKDFDVGKTYERFKLSDHKYIIYFNHSTTINEVLEYAPEIGKTKFRISNYEKLLSIANTNEELPDVVGRIIFVLGSNL
ncbi:hypothetical protein V5N11_008210 [Cardamine amara subsp. amara]|uniref:Replication protein A 70 kDa DNA-binding subunit B/D first OB fold domain-containing protein n=1 Tax=Cardamine amara subsp. amara TaxID=228776 RepID=A0ABD1BSL6_CARAN